MTGTSTFDFRVQYSRIGSLHRWRLFSFGVQVDTGSEKTIEQARQASRDAKQKYITEVGELTFARSAFRRREEEALTGPLCVVSGVSDVS